MGDHYGYCGPHCLHNEASIFTKLSLANDKKNKVMRYIFQGPICNNEP